MDLQTTDSIPSFSPSSFEGRVLENRYELFEHLGSSDRAAVFRAWDHQLQHVVAVKVLHERLIGQPEVVKAFIDVGKLAASLPPHRNIVAIYAVARDHDLPYRVMQFVAGANLKESMSHSGPLPVEEALALGQGIAHGLEFAHEFGLIHGGLRPQNILINRRGEARLTDFGEEQIEQRSETSPKLMSLVRAQYLAPEQTLGRPAGVGSDVYALGVVLFEMLTGQLPFTASDSLTLGTKHVREEPPDPTELNKAIPRAASKIVLRALRKEPSDRYRSASAFADAMREYLLLVKGDTITVFPAPELNLEEESAPPPLPDATRSSKSTTEARIRSPAVTRVVPAFATARPRRLTFTSALFACALAVAVVGGLLTYRAISKAVNGGATKVRTVLTKAHHSARNGRHASITSKPRGAVRLLTKCALPSPGDIRLVHMWAERTSAVSHQPILFDYTIMNTATACLQVPLVLTAFGPGGPVTDRLHNKTVNANPGTHTYKREFAFPTTRGPERFDVLLSVASKSNSGPRTAIKVPQLITIHP